MEAGVGDNLRRAEEDDDAKSWNVVLKVMPYRLDTRICILHGIERMAMV